VWKEAVASCFGTVQAFVWNDCRRPHHMSEEIAGFWAEIWNLCPPNVMQDCNPLNHNVWHIDRSYSSKGLPIPQQGPEHMPQMHRSLIVQPWTPLPPPHGFRRSYLCRQVPPRPYDARDPSSERWNCGRERWPIILPKCRLPPSI